MLAYGVTPSAFGPLVDDMSNTAGVLWASTSTGENPYADIPSKSFLDLWSTRSEQMAALPTTDASRPASDTIQQSNKKLIKTVKTIKKINAVDEDSYVGMFDKYF